MLRQLSVLIIMVIKGPRKDRNTEYVCVCVWMCVFVCVGGLFIMKTALLGNIWSIPCSCDLLAVCKVESLQ